MSELFVAHRRLPEFCYDRDSLTDPLGAVIHYVSALYTAPERKFDIDTVWNQTVELNRRGPDRGWLMPKVTDPKADGFDRYYASYHYVIDRVGDIYRWVPEERQAYHAGVSYWRHRRDCNAWMFGIAAIGTHDSGYTDPQYHALARLARNLMERYGWSDSRVAFPGHEHVAPDRKKDPGPLFQWERFHQLVAA